MARLVVEPAELPVHPPAFPRGFRIVPSRFPPVGVFDELVDPEEVDALYEIETLTNDRLSEDLGLIHLVAPEDRLAGPGATPIMAAFTHPNPGGSRFSDGSFGVYYCGDSEEVAIRESVHHRERFLRLTGESPCRIEMRLYTGEIQRDLHDGLEGRLPDDVLNPEDYTVSQQWGAELREIGSYGLMYPSVRHPGGLCAALFRPPAISPVRQARHYEYRFDGAHITDVVVLGAHHSMR